MSFVRNLSFLPYSIHLQYNTISLEMPKTMEKHPLTFKFMFNKTKPNAFNYFIFSLFYVLRFVWERNGLINTERVDK